MPNATSASTANGNGCLTDEERDEDNDMLTNDDELSGRSGDRLVEGEVRRTRTAFTP